MEQLPALVTLKEKLYVDLYSLIACTILTLVTQSHYFWTIHLERSVLLCHCQVCFLLLLVLQLNTQMGIVMNVVIK